MKEEDKLRENLVKYAEILNNYEKGNYKLSDEEFEFVKQLTKTKTENPELAKKIDKIKDMAQSERKKYIDSYKQLQDDKNNNKTTTQEIAETFDIEEKNIKEERLKDGKTLYVIYNNKLGKNIVLEDEKNNQSLTEELQEMKEEKATDPESIIEDDYTDVIDNKVKENLELSLIPINELNNYLSSIESLTPEKIAELNCLVKKADELGIEYINLDNIVGIDKNGKIFEVYYDTTNQDYRVSGTGDDILESKEKEEEVSNNKELDSMFLEDEEELSNDKQLVEEEQKQLKKEFHTTNQNNYFDKEEDTEEN